MISVIVAIYVKDMYLFLLKIEFNPSDTQIILEVRIAISHAPSHALSPSLSYRVSLVMQVLLQTLNKEMLMFLMKKVTAPPWN